MKVKLVSYSQDYLENILGAMGMCYGKTCGPKALQKSIEAGHLSLLEHSMATFEIECSLGVLGQITRHRHLSFTVKSSRGSEFDEFKIPEEIEKDQNNKEIYMRFIKDAFHTYKNLTDFGVTLEDAAYVLPKGTITKLRVSGNFRAWREYLQKRLCKRAMPEHRKIAERIWTELQVAAPEVFFDSLLNCGNCKESSCKF